jgi:hypothetical protein
MIWIYTDLAKAALRALATTHDALWHLNAAGLRTITGLSMKQYEAEIQK